MVLALAIGLAAPLSHAHSDAHFDALAAPHGGRMRMARPVHLELLVDADRIVLYVTESCRAAAGQPRR